MEREGEEKERSTELLKINEGEVKEESLEVNRRIILRESLLIIRSLIVRFIWSRVTRVKRI